MPRPRKTTPALLSDATGRFFTKVDGKFHSLGTDQAEAEKRYSKLLEARHKGAAVESANAEAGQKPATTINELLVRYFTDELPRFSKDEQHCQRGVIRLLRQMFGQTVVDEFGPLKLRVVREAMVAGDPYAKNSEGKPKPRKPWSREFVNHQVRRLRAIFRWGVSWEMVSQITADRLASLMPLKCGETEAVDYAPRSSVPDADIAAVRAVLTDLHRDIFDLLMLTGARPGELLGLTVGSIDRKSDPWRVALQRHKTRHKGKSRTLYFNAAAQIILLRHFKADPDAGLFDIRRDSFGAAVKRACIKAKVPEFTPHWLRHTVATKLADEVGIEAAQRLLGHADAAMTELYARAAERKAVEAVKRLG